MSNEEVQVIQSIYCGDGEFELYETTGEDGIASFGLQLSSEGETKRLSFKIAVSLPVAYPDVLPEVSIRCPEFTRQQEAKLHASLLTYLQELRGQAMLLEMAQWLQDNAVNYSRNPDLPRVSSTSEALSGHQLTLLHLDHMRARMRYIKTIERWTSELGLCGRLIFLDNLILLVLEGAPEAIKEYLIQARTVSVDVDSRGRSCKERMLSQLVTVDIQENVCRFSNFSVVECNCRADLECLFKDSNLMELYEAYVHKSLLR